MQRAAICVPANIGVEGAALLVIINSLAVAYEFTAVWFKEIAVPRMISRLTLRTLVDQKFASSQCCTTTWARPRLAAGQPVTDAVFAVNVATAPGLASINNQYGAD